MTMLVASSAILSEHMLRTWLGVGAGVRVGVGAGAGAGAGAGVGLANPSNPNPNQPRVLRTHHRGVGAQHVAERGGRVARLVAPGGVLPEHPAEGGLAQPARQLLADDAAIVSRGTVSVAIESVAIVSVALVSAAIVRVAIVSVAIVSVAIVRMRSVAHT